jgi:hypothetical protein
MKTLKILFVLVTATLLMSGCVYKFVVPEDVIDPGDPDTPEISFSQEIVPIFTNNDKCTECHNGGQAPDLSADNAYNSLNSSRYINKSTPEESLIYTYPHPDTDTHKRRKYTAGEAAKVLTWITQGAKNN